MSTKKQSLRLVLTLLVVMLAMGVFVACSPSRQEAKVTFMVTDDNGDWSVYKTVQVNDDGTVNIPANPDKTYYTFRGWYTSTNFSESNKFPNKDINSSIKVYAFFFGESVDVYIDGERIGERALGSIMDGVYNPERENLEFDGWYTDEACKVEFAAGDDATALYGRFMARVNFDNGYEQVFSTLVKPNTAMAKPTVEDIVKPYMCEDDLYYQDAAGNKIEDIEVFTIDKNMTITVKWGTKFTYHENMATGNLIASQLDERWYTQKSIYRDSFYAISILSEVTYNGQKRKVDGVVNPYVYLGLARSLHTVLIDEGIVSLQYAFNNNPTLERIVLPSTIKLIDDSFNALDNLKEVNLPDGVEVILNSFHKSRADRYTSQFDSWTNDDPRIAHDFEIEIPASVINLAQVPDNFTFDKNNRFYKDNNNRVFQKDDVRGDILISDNNVVDGMLEVPEGVKGIQVGAFFGLRMMKTLKLPSTWSFINFNAEKKDYPSWPKDNKLQKYSDNPLWDNDYINDPFIQLESSAYSIFRSLGVDGTKVYINQRSYPSAVPSYALMGTTSKGTEVPYTDDAFMDKVFFIGTVDDGMSVQVRINATNQSTGEISVKNFEFISGQKLTGQIISQCLELDQVGNKGRILSVKSFDKSFDFDVSVSSNQYLDVEWELTEYTGFTTSENSDGTLTVQAYDQTTAYRSEADDGYLVIIPETIAGKTITAIAPGAFKGVQSIYRVVIAKTIKTIGAEAFMNTPNLKFVRITPGGLEVIGRSAFENSGFTTIALPLAKIKSIEPYAFKSQILQIFLLAKGEENRLMHKDSKIQHETLEVGAYYFPSLRTEQEGSCQIIKYMGKTVQNINGEDINVLDVQYIATANAGLRTFRIGYSSQSSLAPDNTIMRFEIMEGSVYFLDYTSMKLEFGIVKYIHKNAFTDIAPTLSTVTVGANGVKSGKLMILSADRRGNLTEEDLATMNPDIFEDGWWEGVLRSDADFDQKMEFMTTKPGNSSYIFTF